MAKKTTGLLILFLSLIASGCAGFKVDRLYNVDQARNREIYISSHDLKPSLIKIIKRGGVRKGMTRGEVRAALGIPLAESKEGTITKWFYWERLLVFRNGILIFYQN